MTLYCAYYRSPIGILKLAASDNYLKEVQFVDREGESDAHPILTWAMEELQAYFLSDLRTWTVPIKLEGTDFQTSVWQALRTIPYGHTASYSDIAKAIGKPKAARAVGGANNKNPISIIVPCHRVIGKDGSLVGYGGGLARKQWLLDHELKTRDKFSRIK